MSVQLIRPIVQRDRGYSTRPRRGQPRTDTGPGPRRSSTSRPAHLPGEAGDDSSSAKCRGNDAPDAICASNTVKARSPSRQASTSTSDTACRLIGAGTWGRETDKANTHGLTMPGPWCGYSRPCGPGSARVKGRQVVVATLFPVLKRLLPCCPHFDPALLTHRRTASQGHLFAVTRDHTAFQH